MEWDELQLRMFDEDKHAKYSLRSLAISHSQQQQLTLLTLLGHYVMGIPPCQEGITIVCVCTQVGAIRTFTSV